MITLDNYEEYMMMHADGELQPHEEQALQAFLNDNPKLQAEMALYENTRLIPDYSLVYAHKDSLMKPLADKKVIAFPARRSYAIAAGIAALIIFTTVALYNNSNNQISTMQVATTTPAHKTETTITATANDTPTAAQVATTSNPKQINTTTVTTPTVKQQSIPAAQHINHANNNNGIAKVKTEKHINKEEQATTASRYVVINSLSIGAMKALPVEKTALTALPLASVGDYTLPAPAVEEHRTWLDRLPLDEDKKKGLNNVATAIANGCEQISEFREKIEERGRGVSLKIQRKKLTVSF